MRRGVVKWSDGVKLQARTDYEMGVATLAELSKRMGIPLPTLQSWAYSEIDRWVQNRYKDQIETDIAAENIKLFAKANCLLEDVVAEIKNGVFYARDKFKRICEVVSTIRPGESVDEGTLNDLKAMFKEYQSVDMKISSDYIEKFLKMTGRYAPEKREVNNKSQVDIYVKFDKLSEAEMIQRIKDAMQKLARVGIIIAAEVNLDGEVQNGEVTG